MKEHRTQKTENRELLIDTFVVYSLSIPMLQK